MYADRLYINGNIYTINEKMPRAKKIAIKNGKIIAFDHEAELMSNDQTEIIDVKGNTILPGFIESHAHPLGYAVNLLQLDLRANNVHSIEDIIQAVRNEAEKSEAGDWILGFGWDETKLKEKRFPTIEELTEAAPNNPVFLKRTCVHNAVVNKKALEESGLGEHPKDPEGGHFHINENTNQLSGLVQENAMDLIKIPSFSIEQRKKAMLKAQEHFFKWGITTIHDMAVTKEEMTVYQQLCKEGKLELKIRMWLWALNQMGWKGVQEDVFNLGIESGLGNDHLNVQGIKYMLDGSVGGRTAAVAQSYENEIANYGILYMEQDIINKHVEQAVKNNLRVSIHGIGETAISMALEAVTKADSIHQIRKMRHRIEHCALPTEEHLNQLVEYDIIAGSSVGFIYSIGDSYLNNLGTKRAEHVFPHATFKKHGIVAPGNSDLPVCHGNPMYGIYSASTRKTISGQQLGTKETISVEDAFKAYTIDAAYSGFDENIIGSLEVGKYADMIMFEEDPFTIDKEQLKNLEVIETIVEGKSVYKK